MTINCSQVATMQQAGPAGRLRPPRGETAVKPVGQLSAAKMAEVGAALKFNLGMR